MPRVALPRKLKGTGKTSGLTSARPKVTVMVLVPSASAMLPAGTAKVTEVASLSRSSTVAVFAGLAATV